MLFKKRKTKKAMYDFVMGSGQPVVAFENNRALGWFNPAFCQLIGYSEKEVDGLDWKMDLTPPEWWPLEDKALEELERTDRSIRYEKEFIRKDGSRVPVEIHSHFYRGAEEENDHCLAFICDLTDRKSAEKNLRENERRMSTLMGNLPGMAYRCLNTPLWPMDFVSEGSRDLTGYPPEELTSNGAFSFGDLIYSEDRDDVWEGIQRAIEADEPYVLEYRISDRNGVERWIWEQGRQVGQDIDGKAVLEGFMMDISRRKRVEWEKNRLIFDMRGRTKELFCLFSVSEAIRTCDDISDILEKSVSLIPGGWKIPEETFCRIRYEELEFTSHSFRESAVFLKEEIMAGGKNCGSIEIFIRDDTAREDHDIFIPEEVELLATISRMLSEAVELKKSGKERLLLAHAIDQAAESVVITDANALIQYVNPAFERYTGYSKEEVLGKNPRILKSYEQDENFYQQMWDSLVNRRSWSGRLVNRKKDGSLFTEKALISPVVDSSGRIINYVGVKHNLTNEIELENQLRQAQKMEAVGRLAGGVAHDFNNMLGIIMGLSDMILDQMDHNHPLYEDISEINTAGRRSSELTRQLLTFARKQIVEPRVLDMNETVSAMIKMLKRLIGENIELGWEPGDSLWPILMDPSQIDQILANLCVNARDAISGTGKVTIKTDNAVLDQKFCRTREGAKPGEYVCLSLNDNGTGMDSTTLEKIFEPFFTTKESGKGTGLGLSMVYGAVKQNDGFIEVMSELGAGTTFEIYLPAQEAGSFKSQKNHREKNNGQGSETILLVEDEPAFLRLIEKMLLREGYKVLAADTPEKAIELCEKYDGDIQLLLTDVIMPEMSGPELSGEISAMRPEMKKLFMSGYTANFIENHNILDKEFNFLQKPFTRSKLTKKIRDVLDYSEREGC